MFSVFFPSSLRRWLTSVLVPTPVLETCHFEFRKRRLHGFSKVFFRSVRKWRPSRGYPKGREYAGVVTVGPSSTWAFCGVRQYSGSRALHEVLRVVPRGARRCSVPGSVRHSEVQCLWERVPGSAGYSDEKCPWDWGLEDWEVVRAKGFWVRPFTVDEVVMSLYKS